MLFALWTLCAHAVVVAGSTLRPLVALFVLAVAAGAFGLRGIRRRGALRAAPLPALPAAPPRSRAQWIAQASLGAGAAAALASAWWISPIALWTVWCAVLGAALWLFIWREPVSLEPPVRARRLEIALWATAGVGVLYALLAHRPDPDDSFYVNLAVAAIDRPDLPLLAVDTLHGREDLPIHFAVYRVHSLELAYAALAWLSGVPAVAVFHYVGAAIAAAALPLANSVLLRWLAPRCWLPAVIALVGVLAIAGETHRWYGNFAFVSMWQGKAIALFVLLPLVQAFAIRFALQPTGRHWSLLAAAQIGALGCSASALWAAPLASGLAMLCALPRSREGLRRALIGALASAYLIAVGLAQRPAMAAASPALKRIYGAGDRLAEALAQTLGGGALALVAVVAIGAVWAAWPRGLAQRFAITVPLGAALLLLDPYTDAWVRAFVVGPSYWRAMWAQPVPLLLALGIVAPLAWPEPGAERWNVRALAASGALALLFALAVPRVYGWSEANGVSLHPPGLKLPDEPARWARIVNERAPRERVLAPRSVSQWIPVFGDHAYPLMVRGYLRPQRSRLGEVAYRDRWVMTRYVGGNKIASDAGQTFARGLDLYDVRLVCLRRSALLEEQRELLRGTGFHRSVNGSRYEIWERSRAGAGAAHAASEVRQIAARFGGPARAWLR